MGSRMERIELRGIVSVPASFSGGNRFETRLAGWIDYRFMNGAIQPLRSYRRSFRT
jgi:hypothetical protein